MTYIQTKNLIISEESCKLLDRLVFGSKPVPTSIHQKHAVCVAELKELLMELNPSIAKTCGTCAYELFLWIDRIQRDQYKLIEDQRNGNIHTAHNQLKNWR